MCLETFKDHSLFQGHSGRRSEIPQKEEEEEEEDSSQKVRWVRRGDIIGEINTINLRNLIWGDQYQPSISKLPSSRSLNLENFNILLTLFHMNESTTSDRGMLLTRWSTQHLVPTVDLRIPYHFLWIDHRCWLGRGRWRWRWWWWWRWRCDDKIFTLVVTKLFWDSQTL